MLEILLEIGHLLSTAPSSLMLYAQKFLQSCLLAGSPAVRNRAFSMSSKSLCKNSADVSYPESVYDHKKAIHFPD